MLFFFNYNNKNFNFIQQILFLTLKRLYLSGKKHKICTKMQLNIELIRWVILDWLICTELGRLRFPDTSW